MTSQFKKYLRRKLHSKFIDTTQNKYKIKPVVSQIILYSPLFLIFLYFLLFLNPLTRQAALSTLNENRLIENITFIAFVLTAIKGGEVAFKLNQKKENCLFATYFLLFTIAAILVAMEEIAWGQTILGFKTPEFWQQINLQGETTLHNISALQGHSEVLRLVFGGCAFISMVLSRDKKFQNIAFPLVLFFWVMIITSHATLDVFNDFIPIHEIFDYYMQRTSELIEMMIGICCLLYIFLKARMFKSLKMVS